jgi:hypothetical protein
MEKERRIRSEDRRQCRMEITGVPFKDSNGATVREDRRLMPDRRLNSVAVEWEKGEPESA